MTNLNASDRGLPVGYMERTRLFYEAQGYDRAYRWARFDEVPFSRLSKPLAEVRLMLVTTASPLRADAGANAIVDAEADAASADLNDTLLEKKSLQFRDSSRVPEGLYTDDLSWDKEATHTRDLDSYFPLRALQERVREGQLGGLTASYACVPTEYSQRQTIDADAPATRDRALAEGADVALLVPL
ncbi:MAG: hypothetical protein AAF648_04210 [Pseudomonadota bacterium]